MKRPKFLHYVSYTALRLCMGVFGILPAQTASSIGGFLGRAIGPYTRFQHIAKRNLSLCLPHTDHANILRDMWGNLGRTIAEYPHTQTLAKNNTRMVDPQNATALLRQSGGVFLSGHVGNWEVMTAAQLFLNTLPMHAVYRPPNNPLIDVWLKRTRGYNDKISLFGKTRKGAIEMMRALSAKECIGILMDQKDNTGETLRFFGQPANTNISFAQMALRTGTKAAFGTCRRFNKTQFEITLEPLDIEHKTPAAIAQDVLEKLENFIRANPEQYLWIHRRFDKELY